jgi:hypothetical protein
MSIDPVQVIVAFGQAADPVEVVPVRPASAGSGGAQPVPESGAELDILPQARQLQVNASFGEGNTIIYRILDKNTGDLILQIPPEQLLEIAQSVRELLRYDSPQPSLDVRW